MCSIKARKKTSEALLILKQASKYLKENKNLIIDKNYININSKDKSYIDELQENKDNFLKSIDGDFDWMIDYLITPNKKQVDIDSPKYKNFYVVTSLHLAYCDFYQEFFNDIDFIEKNPKVKDRLKKIISKGLLKKYKCN